jgi:hypothetical protein
MRSRGSAPQETVWKMECGLWHVDTPIETNSDELYHELCSSTAELAKRPTSSNYFLKALHPPG